MNIPLVLLGLAFLIWPACYVILIVRMRSVGIARPPWLPLFFLFGTFGGWLLAFALSPSGLTAICVLFLATAAPLSVLMSSIYLVCRPERSIYHRIALWGGFAYVAMLGVFALVSVLLGPKF